MGEPSGLASPREQLRARARTTPHRRAAVFLDDGGAETAELTYAGLLGRARALAARLGEHARPGDRALLVFAPGLEFLVAFYGCLEAGVIAVPVPPPRRGAQNSELQRGTRHVLADAEPEVVLADAVTARGLGDLGPTVLTVGLEEAPADGADSLDDRPVDPDAVAFLQYTSGSTSLPKGVMVTHGNLAANHRMITHGFGQDEHSPIVGWAPLFHDQGLIGNVLQPLGVGSTAVLMSPATFVRRPLAWPEAVSRYRARSSGGPDFAFAVAAAAAERHGLPEGLDLRCWRVAFDGAEPIRASTLRRFAAAFAPAGFAVEALHPCYGLAEATLLVTGSRVGRAPRLLDADPAGLAAGRVVPTAPARGLDLNTSGSNALARTLVGSGEVPPDAGLRIVDPESGRECPDGTVGEIRVRGPHVTAGYWLRPDASTEAYGTDRHDRELRTGDLGVLVEGELYVVGRHSDLIVARGRNHHPSDIEATVAAAHPALGQAGPATVAAFGLADREGGAERVVVVAELRPDREGPAHTVITTAVRAAVLREHDVALAGVVLTRRGVLPRTSSGKIQRRAAREIHLAGGFPAPPG
ncbi:fatty acyl-AMP ligase [Pseudonocardia tropica]|uniref:Fatty acyl-AMP ligase n=1 Tax=Pseudonocardia tropica TaxID=681289 RepID=A0ABV1K0Z9_9PSEU